MRILLCGALTTCLWSAGCEKSVRDERVKPLSIAPGGHSSADPDGGRADSGGLSDAGTPGWQDPAEDEPELPPQKFSKRALLAAAASCALNRMEAFRAHALTLRTETKAFAQDPTSVRRSAAQQAFLAAYASFQQVELFRFGPVARMMDDPAGKDVRDRIYAFPQANPCMVDQRIVDKKYTSAFTSLLIGARGLSALEYLLFNSGSQNACADAVGINKSGGWVALGASGMKQRRADYAAAAAKDVVAQMDGLLAAWSSDGGGFADALRNGGGEVYDGEQAALNAVSHGLFYLEKEIKDLKLGLPLGLVEGCVTAPCLERVESPYAKVSTDNLRQNLIGFRRLFEGCGKNGTGLGFDEWLREVGASDLANDMVRSLADAQASLDTLDPALEQTLASNVDKALAVHAAVKKLNDLLKTDFVTTLNLDLPMGAVGDND